MVCVLTIDSCVLFVACSSFVVRRCLLLVECCLFVVVWCLLRVLHVARCWFQVVRCSFMFTYSLVCVVLFDCLLVCLSL